MALSARKDDALVKGSDGNDVFGNTAAGDIFKGCLNNDVYRYLISGVDPSSWLGILGHYFSSFAMRHVCWCWTNEIFALGYERPGCCRA